MLAYFRWLAYPFQEVAGEDTEEQSVLVTTTPTEKYVGVEEKCVWITYFGRRNFYVVSPLASFAGSEK